MALIGRSENQKATSGRQRLHSLKVTLSAGVALQVFLPDFAQGFALRPTQEIRFAVGETVETGATTTNTPVLKTEFKLGGIAEANLWEVRTLPEGTDVYLSLLSSSGATCDVEIF
jgi:hypothetical protein